MLVQYHTPRRISCSFLGIFSAFWTACMLRLSSNYPVHSQGRRHLDVNVYSVDDCVYASRVDPRGVGDEKSNKGRGDRNSEDRQRRKRASRPLGACPSLTVSTVQVVTSRYRLPVAPGALALTNNWHDHPRRSNHQRSGRP